MCVLSTPYERAVYVQLRSCVHWVNPMQPRKEAYSEPSQISNMENFCENSLRL